MSGVDEEEDGAKGGQPEDEPSPGRSLTHESSPGVKPTPPAPPQWRSDDDRRFSGLARQEGPSGWSKTGEQPKTTMKATKTIFVDVPPSRCALCRGLLTDPVRTTCGHQTCRQCLISYYDPSAPSKDFFCPQCGERTRLCMESIRKVEISDEHKVGLRRTFEHGSEGSDEPGGRTALDRIDTDMYITEGLCQDSNTQRYLKILPGRPTKIKSTDIFQVFIGQRKSIRLVLTSGIAGIGKTLLVQRFTLEWANGSKDQDVSMIFLLSFRELNLIRDKQYSLLELLSAFYPTLQEVTDVDLHRLKLLFILDGLDESRFSLDFENKEVVIDVNQASSVGTLLTNLIRGNLLPSALLWITTRPAAAGQILPRYVDRETEMEGFTDAQQKKYFRRRFSDEVLSDRIISHIKTSKNLHTMCRIPLSCRVTATVLEHIVGKTHGGALPKTLTNLYAHFLMVQIKKGMHKTVERHEEKKVNKGENTTDKVFLLKLGKLALEHLEKGNIMFFQEDLDQCGLDATEVATFSEVYTEIFKRECVIFQKPVYCFVHLSIQGFLAAVYLFNCIINGNTVVLESFLGVPQNRDVSQDVFFKRAMEKSLESKNGHLDLFVRFLHGLSLWSNQKLLVDLLGPTQDKPELMTKAIDNLKTMTRRDMSPDRNVNIFHCLMEINSLSVHPEIQDFLRSQRLSTVHCSALADMLQMSEEVLDELNLTEYNASPEGRERLIPAVRNCRKAVLSDVRFSSAHSEIVASALESDPSHLRELDLTGCFLDSSQMLRLCKGLKSKNCRLETLRLRNCRLFKKGCVDLVSALQFNPSHLRNLDLTSTHLEDSVVEQLRHFVENPKSQLKSLRISKSSKSSEREMWGWTETSVDLCLESTSALSEGKVRLLEILDEHKVGLRRTFEHGSEGSDEPGGRTALDRIDTDMYITEGLCEDSNTQRDLKILPGRRTKIKSTDIFQVFPRQRKSIRLVLTSGLAGIGKTLLVQRFTLEWANGSENQDVSMIFLLSFRELNLIRDKQYSLLELLSAFYPTLQEVTDVDLHRLKLLFILDGLDESRFSLDFENEEVVIDVKQASSVGTLLTNLIQGNLLPSALLWITTRPAAAGQILPRYVDRETEMEGFTDAQQKKYFRRRFSDEVLSDRIISHIKTSKNLHTMCRIPLSCRVTATVLEHIVGKTHGGALPKTLTNLYAHFLMVQIKKGMHKTVERHEEKKVNKGENTTDKVFLLKLGKLALEHLEKGNIMFFQEDLDQCGLDATEVATFSEVYTEIFKRECVIFQKPVYCFVHLSIQGFLAAVYLFNCIINGNTVVLESFFGVPQKRDASQDVFFKRAMEKSLESKNGHLDLFVRFLHGLSLWSNQKLLVDLLGPTQDKPELMTKAIDNLKTMTSRDMSPDRNVNIFHCLMEINSLSVHPEIQDFLRSQRLSTVHCSALADMLQMSEEVLDELNLMTYNASPEGRERLIPAVRNCRKAVLSGVRFSSAHSEIVASALESDPSHLKELDLRRCFLDPSQMSRLCEGLKSKNCRLETLRLSGVGFSSAHSEIVASALKSDPSHLRELDLRGFDLNPPQMLRLCKGLKNKNCRLETLRLRDCRLFGESCFYLVSALQFNPSHLRNLDLTSTHLEDSFVEELRHLVENPKSQLKSLRISKSSKSSEREMWTSVDLCLESTSALSEDVANMKLGAESDRFEENTKLEKIPKSFTPEVNAESTEISFSYLCPGPGLFQCALTGLVFFTVGEAKLQYCMAQWDESLLQTAGKRPAGPLFNIYCPDDAVRELHFPHCHIEAVPLSAGLLSVAHVSDPGMSVLTPLAITHTHVVVKVPHLSLFGLLWDVTSRFWSKTTPIRSQVLLFLRPPNTKTKKKNLHVLLLPSNVPVEVVRAKHRDSLYIAAPSDCQLVKDEDYSVRCPHALLVQPPKKDFHQDFGPNFHPTFEIRLPSDTEETTVTVEKQSLTAWVCEVDLSGQPRKSLESDAEKILFLKRDQIVQRISEATLRKLLDELFLHEVIHDEEMQDIKKEPIPQEKARSLIDMVRKKGKASCLILTETLRKLEPDLSNELQLA